ncbi:hypothetical protein [Rhizobium mongolense]|uniref:hypothetical protein n=1 Tax=Rhizobium mongolense TaxID=57676 RepID=UPI0034A226FF
MPADDLHVTITYSRTHVDWMAMGSAWDDEVKIPRGGPAADGAVRRAVRVEHELGLRRVRLHITISYDDDAPELATVEPYQGEILLGPEVSKEVIDDWLASVREVEV